MSEQTEKTTAREARWAAWGWRLLVWVIVLILVLVVLAQNTGPVRVDIFFLSWRISMATWSLVCAIVGAGAAVLIFWARARR